MKQYSKILFTILITALLLTTGITVNAQDYSKSCVVNGKANDVNSYYVLSYKYSDDKSGTVTLNVAAGEFEIVAIEEGLYDPAKDVKENFVSYGAPQYLLTDVNSLIGKKIVHTDTNSTSEALKLKVKNYSGEDGRTLRVTVALTKTDSKCMSKDDYDKAVGDKTAATYTGYFYIQLIDYNATTPAKVANDKYATGACYALRTGDNSSGVIDSTYWSRYDANAGAHYRQLASYCYNESVDYNYSDAQVLNMVKAAIQSHYIMNVATTTQPAPSFLEAFNASKNAARQAGGKHYQENVTSKSLTVDKMYCDYKKIGTLDSSKKTGYEYVNKTSFYASQITKVPVTYKKHYDGQAEQTQTIDNACIRTCEEAVDVEYGPPQAAIGGFCIEYQVKVTSRVKCESQVNVQPPQEEGVCQPVPYCIHSNGFENVQGGPNEDFDACVNQCDGGKYTQSCSTKCYNKVYVNGSKKNMADYAANSVATFMANAIPTGGYYTRSSNGTVIWVSTGPVRSRFNSTYAQWYIDHRYYLAVVEDEKNGGPYFADANGFKRKDYGKYNCNGICSNIGCGANTYLRSETAQSDYSENLQAYLTAIDKCKAAATCTTKTANFTMTAEYTDSSNKNITINYPINTKDELNSVEDQNDRVQTIPTNTTLLSYDGCYKSGKEGNWYQAEWTFPGTWVNNKTGEISFQPKPTSGWHEAKNKFCLPLDIKNVNVNWWNWYMAKKRAASTTTATSGSYTSDEYNDTCTNVNSGANSSDYKPEKYNIHAKTENFGYFGWKFEVDCFFAVSDGTSTTQTKEQNNKCDTKFNNYSTRTVTNEDLFPSDEQSGQATSTKNNATNTGRTPGFNWTAAASIPENKNEVYANNPEVIIGKIQHEGKSIYDENKEDTYLDYEFQLSTKDLNNIRKDNKRLSSYNDWQGTSTKDKNANVYVYSSSLFRSGGILNNSGAVKKLGKLGCNNQANKDACDKDLK